MAVTDRDVAAIHHMLVYSMANGSARAPVDAQKSMEYVYRTVTSKTGAVALMAFMGERFVGTIGIEQSPYWYSRDEFLHDAWLYVPEEFENMGVMAALMKEARAIADMAGMSILICAASKGRKRGAKREHVATVYQYSPAGEIYAFHPKEP